MKYADLIKQMTLEEKVSLLSGKDYWHTVGVERLGIPSVTWTDGPHGIRKRSEDSKTPGLKGVPAVCFPTAATVACSWDVDLAREMGELLGEECRKEKVAVLLGPGANMKRSPLCGRNFEYYSEDPVLAGEIAAGYINGVQSKGIGTSLKHFAVNNQETRRMTVNAVADERTLREIYLAAYEIAVKKANPATIMCSYNRLNGDYASENKWLLTDVLRKDFGYKGMVVTDWGACNDRVKGLEAGQNLEMPTSNGDGAKKIIEALKAGEITEELIDEMADGVLDVIMSTKDSLDGRPYDYADHHKAARHIAGQSMVLMKNEDKILPLSKKAKIAVIGRMAKTPRYQGAGSSLVNPPMVDDAYGAMLRSGIDASYADGYPAPKHDRKSIEAYIKEAVTAAAKAEVAVIFAGLTEEYEAEGFDRKTLRIPASHVALIEAVGSTNPNTVVVLAGGSVVETPWAGSAKAILNSVLSGEASGSAVVDILFGDVNPSGKLAETYPVRLSDTPAYNFFPGNHATVEYREGVYIGYRYYDTAKKDVAFPFGFGLSYTTFEYSDIKLSNKKLKMPKPLKVTFTVKNTGDVAGAEVVQVYVRDTESTIYRPDKELKAFTKIFLEPGEAKTVTLELDKRAFAFYDAALGDWHVESGDFEILVGASSRDIRLSANVNVASDIDAPCPDYRETAPDYYGADVQNISAEQFAAVYGKDLPDPDVHAYPNLTAANTFEDSAEGRNGRMICNFIGKLVNPDSLAGSIAFQLPIKNFTSMSMGVFSAEAADQLLDILNDKKPITLGFIQLIAKVLPDVIKGIPTLTKSI